MGAQAEEDGGAPLYRDRPGRRELRLAVLLTGLMIGTAVATLPFAGTDLGAGPSALAAYATAILMTDVMTAALLLSIHAARPSRAIVFLSLGYLFTGLAAAPWALTFPGVFSETGLFGAGLQTTAVIAAARRIAFPAAILAYALQSGRETGQMAIPTRSGVLAGVAATLAAVLGVTWFAIAAGEVLPPLMQDARLASTAWDAVPALAAVICVLAMARLWRREPMCALDLWLMVVLATQLIEITMLAWLGSATRFSVGWWTGRMVGLVSSSVVLIALTFETMAVYDRLLRAAKAEQRTREARLASMQALLGAIAHEVNQPLASIASNAGAALRWVRRPQPDLDEAIAALEQIAAEGHRAADVIEGMRALLRGGVRSREPFDANRLARQCLDAMEEEARLARISIRAELADGLPPIAGDRVQVRQAILNLVANAIDAMRTVPGARILTVVTTSRADGSVLIQVEDTGPGVAPEDAERIFEPFFTTKRQGIGLGLMIARSAAQAHGGTLEVRGGAGRGTVFEIALPAAAGGAALSETAAGTIETAA